MEVHCDDCKFFRIYDHYEYRCKYYREEITSWRCGTYSISGDPEWHNRNNNCPAFIRANAFRRFINKT